MPRLNKCPHPLYPPSSYYISSTCFNARHWPSFWISWLQVHGTKLLACHGGFISLWRRRQHIGITQSSLCLPSPLTMQLILLLLFCTKYQQAWENSHGQLCANLPWWRSGLHRQEAEFQWCLVMTRSLGGEQSTDANITVSSVSETSESTHSQVRTFHTHSCGLTCTHHQ